MVWTRDGVMMQADGVHRRTFEAEVEPEQSRCGKLRDELVSIHVGEGCLAVWSSHQRNTIMGWKLAIDKA